MWRLMHMWCAFEEKKSRGGEGDATCRGGESCFMQGWRKAPVMSPLLQNDFRMGLRLGWLLDA